MKSFAVTLLIIAACFLAYDYFLAPPQERMVFPRPPEAAAAPITPPTSSQPSHAADSKPQPGSAAPSTASTPVVSSPPSTSVQSPKPAESTQADAKPVFHPPRLDSIETLTNDWRKLPKSAFPRPVKLRKDTTFTFAHGASTVRAGADAVALSLENGLLVVAPTESSPARQAVPVDDTDLKSICIALYEKWKSDRVEEARKQFEERQRQPKTVVATTTGVDASGKPERSGDGSYPLVMAKLRTGSPSEITPTNITRWGEAATEALKGTSTWTIPVTYKTKTMFGDTEVETLVHIQKGRIVEWIYKGSGEPVL